MLRVMSPVSKSEALRAQWMACFGVVPPIGHQLRQAMPQRWWRMHHLPQSRRYPSTAADWAEALARHKAVASWLLGEATADWRIEVCTAREAGEHRWLRVPIDASEWAEALRARQTAWRTGDHDAAMAAVLDEREGPRLWADLARGCAYAPYPGGADLICVDAAQRAQGRARFADWLSPQPSGM